MIQTANPITSATPAKKRQSVFLLAFQIGAAIAVLHTLIDAVRIWAETPTAAQLIALGTRPDATGLLAYRLSMLIGAGFVNLITWFVLALVLVFVIRAIKRV